MSSNGYVFVHVGKCGGSSAMNEFRNHGIFIESVVHISKAKYNKNKKYIILIRNPIQRFISAFNWRYKLVCDEQCQSSRFVGEKDTLEKYKNVNVLAESISDFSVKRTYIHHIKEDIHYYLESFLKNCNKENILTVMTTETLTNDFTQFFHIDISKAERLKENKIYDTYLSPLGYNNLKIYLRKDYECIDTLYELGVLSQEKYDLLSK